MKILFLSDNFPPETNAPANRTFEHCQEWVRNGAEVTVITCAPNFPQGRVYDGYRNRFRQVETIAGIRVVRVWSYIAPNLGIVRRIIDYTSFAAGAVIAGLFEKADVIVATSPQFFTAVAGGILSLCKRRPWIFEVRDLWPESIAAVGAIKRGMTLRLLEKLELALYRSAKAVVVVTESFRRNITERGIAADKITVVPNGVASENFSARPKDGELLRLLGLEGKFIVSYIGTHGLAHRLDFILECAAAESDIKLHFLLVGDGAEKKNLVCRLRDLKLTNVSLLDPVTREEVPRYLSISDISLINLRRAATFTGVLPSKIFESAAMERPILLGVEGEAQELVERFGAGLCFEPENHADFAEKLARLRGDPAFYEQCRQGCRRLAETYNRRRLAQEMFEILAEASGSG